MFTSKPYQRSPIWAQEGVIALRAYARAAIREGRLFARYCREINETQWLPADRLEALQRERLARILTHAARTVPFYRDLFPDLGNKDLGNKDLARFPLIDKNIVRSRPKAFLSDAMGFRPIVRGSTSGTSGGAIEVRRDFACSVLDHAVAWRQRSWTGYRPGDRRAWFRGDMIVPQGATEGPYWRTNRAENMLMLSSYHLTPAVVGEIRAAIEHFDPVVIEAYPSSIALLARDLEERGAFYAGPSLRGILTSSETVSDLDRAIIERRFRCRLFDLYGSYETGTAIVTCEHGGYHVNADTCLVEFLEPDADGAAEMAVTPLFNLAMPLIRYRTGDLAVPMPDAEPCPCGRAFPRVAKVLGRADDVVVTPDGRRIGRLDHIFKGQTGIGEAQIVQETRDSLRFLVVPVNGSKVDEAGLRAAARTRLGADMKLDIEYVPSLPRGPRGKLKAVVSKLA